MDRIGARVPVESLRDVSSFLCAAEQLKSLLLWRSQLLARDSGVLRSLERQITSIIAVCTECAKNSKRVSVLWNEAQKELAPLLEEGKANEQTTEG